MRSEQSDAAPSEFDIPTVSDSRGAQHPIACGATTARVSLYLFALTPLLRVFLVINFLVDLDLKIIFVPKSLQMGEGLRLRLQHCTVADPSDELSDGRFGKFYFYVSLYLLLLNLNSGLHLC